MLKFIFIAIFLGSICCQAQEANKGLLELEETTKKALIKEPNNPHLLYNSGWIDYKNQRNSIALAKWRKALFINPLHTKSKDAIQHLLEQNNKLQQANPFSGWNYFVESWIVATPNFSLYVFSLVLLHLFLWNLIKYIGQRKKAVSDNSTMPLPPAKIFYQGLFATILTSFCLLKLYYNGFSRGSIIANAVELRITPSKDATKISSVDEGSLVYILKSMENWDQIRVLDGSSGWVPSSSVYKISE